MRRDSNITIFLLIVVTLIIIFTSYGWFIRNEAVSVFLEGNVDSWNIKFEPGEGEITEDKKIEIPMDKIYPGIEVEKKIVITNNGDIDAVLEGEIGENITIFGTDYDLDYYPFKVSCEFENGKNLYSTEENNTNICTITFSWPYEDEEVNKKYTIGQNEYSRDEFDTELANKAKESPSDDNIIITVELTAKSS